MTVAPQNIKAINNGKEWGVEGMRLAGMKHLCGTGFLTTDGDLWQHSRKLLKPSFARKNLEDLQQLAKQIDCVLVRLPVDGETVDLQPHFYDMVGCCAYVSYIVLIATF
jgi:cytochrome P450